MSELKNCPVGHLYDGAWPRCPYCEPEGEARPAPIAWLSVIEEDLDDDVEVRRFEIFEGTTVIGKDPDCDLRLDAEYISTRHARIEAVKSLRGWRFILTDLGSTNGTFINEAIRPVDQVELKDDDRVTFGGSHLLFRLAVTGSKGAP